MKLILVFLIAIVSSAAFGQRGAVEALPPIENFYLAATSIGVDNVAELYYAKASYNQLGQIEREYIELPVSNARRGREVEVSIVPPVQLYIKSSRQPTQEDPRTEIMKPVMEIPVTDADSRFLLVFYYKSVDKPSFTLLDDSYLVHPEGTVRVANLTEAKLAVSVGGPPVTIPANDDKVVGEPIVNDRKAFGFRLAVDEGNNTYNELPPQTLRLRKSSSRLLAVFTLLPRVNLQNVVEDGEVIDSAQTVTYEPVAYRLFD